MLPPSTPLDGWGCFAPFTGRGGTKAAHLDLPCARGRSWPCHAAAETAADAVPGPLPLPLPPPPDGATSGGFGARGAGLNAVPSSPGTQPLRVMTAATARACQLTRRHRTRIGVHASGSSSKCAGKVMRPFLRVLRTQRLQLHCFHLARLYATTRDRALFTPGLRRCWTTQRQARGIPSAPKPWLT